MNGQKKKPLVDRVEELERLISNLQISIRLNQTMLKNISATSIKLDSDVSNMMGVINDLQYRTLSMLQTDVFDRDQLNSIADDLKLKDFNKASDDEDIKNGYVVGEITTPDSIVIITSTSIGNDNDSGIFRSKLAIKDTVLPELKQKLVGIKVGDHVRAKINGVEHDIELLGIRDIPKKEEDNKQIPLATPQ